MTDTLFDATLQAARHLGYVRSGVATGGSTTTLVDTDRTEQDDFFGGGGGLWIVSTGDGAAPQGEFGEINDWDNATSTATIDDALTATVESGDRYYTSTGKIPLSALVDAVNDVLGTIRHPKVDTTSLDTVSEQTEYSLPAAVMTGDLLQVWVETVEDDANDHRWTLVYNWEIEYGDTGSADTLILPADLDDGLDLKLVYAVRHSPIYSATDEISEFIPLERVTWEAAANAAMWLRRQNTGDPTIAETFNFLQSKANAMQARYPIRLPRKTSKILNY